LNNEDIIKSRWEFTDSRLRDFSTKYKRLSRKTQDNIQRVFNDINYSVDNLFNYADTREKERVNRLISELKTEGKLTGYFSIMAQVILNNNMVKNSEILHFLIYYCFLEEQMSLIELENVLFSDISNHEYMKAQQEVYDKNSKIKPRPIITIKKTFLYGLLGLPNPKGYIWSEYHFAVLMNNADKVYRQALINLQQGQELDIENDIYQHMFKLINNRYLNINGDIITGDLVTQSEYLVNKSVAEGYKEADPKARARFLAEVDGRTTLMCRTLDNQVFYVDDWNTFSRYSDGDGKNVVYKVFGLEVGANLPPINNHFHHCRSTITYQV
jgi:hypothetical protein